jgi:hypothetical protein
MSTSLQLKIPSSRPQTLDNMTVCLFTSSVVLSLNDPLTILADGPEFDAFAWYCTETANNPQKLQPPYSAHDVVDRNTGAVPMTDQDPMSYLWYTGAVLPQSQTWPYQVSADAQSLSPPNGPISIAHPEYAPYEQAEFTRPVLTSVSVKRPYGQLNLDEMSTGDEQMTPRIAKSYSSGFSAVRSPPELKAARRNSCKSQVRKPAVTHSNRTPHNLIERRYRHKLQSELDNLTSKIPGWDMEDPVGIDIENAEAALKSRSKASAIAAAAKHIDSLKRDNESKALFVKTLQGQIEGLQKLVNCDDCAVMRCLQDRRVICRAE